MAGVPTLDKGRYSNAEELNRGCTEGSPTARLPGVRFWFLYWVLYQGEPVVLCVAIPGIPEVAQRNPGFFSCTDLLIGSRHSLNRFHGWYHGASPSFCFPKSMSSDLAIISLLLCRASGKM